MLQEAASMIQNVLLVHFAGQKAESQIPKLDLELNHTMSDSLITNNSMMDDNELNKDDDLDVKIFTRSKILCPGFYQILLQL